jgi:hypothetical protein
LRERKRARERERERERENSCTIMKGMKLKRSLRSRVVVTKNKSSHNIKTKEASSDRPLY